MIRDFHNFENNSLDLSYIRKEAQKFADSPQGMTVLLKLESGLLSKAKDELNKVTEKYGLEGFIKRLVNKLESKNEEVEPIIAISTIFGIHFILKALIAIRKDRNFSQFIESITDTSAGTPGRYLFGKAKNFTITCVFFCYALTFIISNVHSRKFYVHTVNDPSQPEYQIKSTDAKVNVMGLDFEWEGINNIQITDSYDKKYIIRPQKKIDNNSVVDSDKFIVHTLDDKRIIGTYDTEKGIITGNNGIILQIVGGHPSNTSGYFTNDFRVDDMDATINRINLGVYLTKGWWDVKSVNENLSQARSMIKKNFVVGEESFTIDEIKDMEKTQKGLLKEFPHLDDLRWDIESDYGNLISTMIEYDIEFEDKEDDPYNYNKDKGEYGKTTYEEMLLRYKRQLMRISTIRGFMDIYKRLKSGLEEANKLGHIGHLTKLLVNSYKEYTFQNRDCLGASKLIRVDYYENLEYIEEERSKIKAGRIRKLDQLSYGGYGGHGIDNLDFWRRQTRDIHHKKREYFRVLSTKYKEVLDYFLDGSYDLRDPMDGEKIKVTDLTHLDNFQYHLRCGRKIAKFKKIFISRLPKAQKDLIWKGDKPKLSNVGTPHLFDHNIIDLSFVVDNKNRLDLFFAKVAKIKKPEDFATELKKLKSDIIWDIDIMKEQVKKLNYAKALTEHENHLVVEVTDNSAVTALCSSTNWCIKDSGQFDHYTRNGNRQLVVFNFNKEAEHRMSIIGITFNTLGKITHSHDRRDGNILSWIRDSKDYKWLVDDGNIKMNVLSGKKPNKILKGDNLLTRFLDFWD